jgi:hypothetical protein
MERLEADGQAFLNDFRESGAQRRDLRFPTSGAKARQIWGTQQPQLDMPR